MGVRRIYAAVTPYPEGAVREVDYAQMVDVVFLTHRLYPVQKGTFYSAVDWRYSEVTFGPIIAPPTALTATASFTNTTGAHSATNEYVATRLSKGSPKQESRASVIATCTNDLTLDGNYNTLTLPALPADTEKYIIYKKMGGSFGYVGFTEDTTFRDGPPPIQPILSDTPPKGENPFVGVGNYPAKVGFHQQRLVLGRTDNVVNGTWLSRSADYENLDKAQIARADDSIAFAIASNAVNEIKAYSSLDDLLTFTGDNVFAVAGDGDASVLTPSAINPKRQNRRGASGLKPLEVDTIVFYQPTQGSAYRSLGYTFEMNGYKSDDVAIFSTHLFEGYGITSHAFQETPFSCIWASRSDGALLCFTWQMEQEVWGWTVCDTPGFVEQVEVIPESGYHRVYILVRRTINGVERRFYERMALPHLGDRSTACHLDCSVTRWYDPPSPFIDRLWHLEGETVSVVFDSGYVLHDQLVADGRIDFPDGITATTATAGLRYSGRLETLPPPLMTDRGSVQSNRQQIDEVVVRTIDTTGIEIGAYGTELEQVAPEAGNDINSFDVVALADHKVIPPGSWDDTSYVVVEQNEPLPAHIVGIFASMKVSPR